MAMKVGSFIIISLRVLITGFCNHEAHIMRWTLESVTNLSTVLSEFDLRIVHFCRQLWGKKEIGRFGNGIGKCMAVVWRPLEPNTEMVLPAFSQSEENVILHIQLLGQYINLKVVNLIGERA